MAHPDQETRVGAHDIFFIVLMPSTKCPPRMESSETVAWLPFGSATQKLNGGGFSFQDEDKHASEHINGPREEESQAADLITKKHASHPSRRESSSFNHSFSEGETV